MPICGIINQQRRIRVAQPIIIKEVLVDRECLQLDSSERDKGRSRPKVRSQNSGWRMLVAGGARSAWAFSFFPDVGSMNTASMVRGNCWIHWSGSRTTCDLPQGPSSLADVLSSYRGILSSPPTISRAACAFLPFCSHTDS